MLFCLFARASFDLCAYSQSSNLQLPIVTKNQLEQSASQVAERIQRSQMLLNRPGIVVLDFANLIDKNRSQLGVVLADQFSDALENYAYRFAVIPRKALRDFLQVHWLDGEEVRNEEVAKWLTGQVHGIAAIQGTIELLSNGQAKLLLRLVGLGPARTIEVRLADSADFHDLFEQVAPSSEPEADKIGEEPGVYKFGDPGIVMPERACVYCPTPEYTDLARKVKYQGTVQLSAILGPDGRLSAIKVIKYAPFGLAERAIETVHNWQMKPCQKDGKPVAVRVPIETTWRLF